MHAMEGAVENRRNVNTAEEDKTKASSSRVPQNQQNGAALPEETATAPRVAVNRVITKNEMKNVPSPYDEGLIIKGKQLLTTDTSRQKAVVTGNAQRRTKSQESIEGRKRKSANGQSLGTPGSSRKKFRTSDEREQLILTLTGSSNETIEQLIARAHQLRSDILASI